MYSLYLHVSRILPESPIWLVANKRYDEAERVLQQMARLNGVKVNGRLLPGEGQELAVIDKEDQEKRVESSENPLLKVKEKEAEGKEEKLCSADDLRFHHLFTDPKLRKHMIVSMLLWLAFHHNEMNYNFE